MSSSTIPRAPLAVRTFLVRGLVAGLLAGFAAFAVAYVVGEPPVDAAIQIEESGAAAPAETEAHSHAEGTEAHSHDEASATEGHSHGEDAAVSRGEQSTGGLLTATVVFGTALGGIVGVVTAFATGRLGRFGPAASAGVVTGLGFLAYYLVPYTKYPPNPPAVGSGDTIGARTADYFSMVVVSVVAVVVAVAVARAIAARRGAFTGIAAAAVGYVVVVVVAGLLLRTHQEVPDTFPAALLWQFRLASLMTQAALWGVLGLVLAGLLDRDWRRAGEPRERAELVGAGR
ncbi:MAG: CbtA family protein [Nocardioidaceae bacterium]|nr:CbtA family protein [Nocardioidaceae bacterium]